MPHAIVVGAGGISGAWFPPLKAEGIDIAAVVDLNLDAARQRIEQHELPDARALDDLDKALADHDADFVVDLTVPAAHCEVTCKALEAGCHVIGEKPMAASFDQARRMVEASERTGRLYMVSQSRRWNPGVLEAANAVSHGLLGALTAIHCDFFLGAHFGGFRAAMDHVLLVDMAIHHFDLARKLGRVDPLGVYCQQFNPVGSWYADGPAANALFDMSDGVKFAYRGSWCDQGRKTSWDGDWRLQCVEGSIHYEQDQPAVAHRVVGDAFVRESRPVDLTTDQPEVRGQRAALREMLGYLADGTMPQSECHDNIKSFAMVTAAIESARTSRRVDIEKMLA